MSKRAEEIDFEQAVYKAFGQVKDFTLAMRIAKYFYEQAEKDCREEVASCKAKNWQEGYNEGYKRAKSENVLDWEDEVVLDWEDEVVVDEDGFPCIKTLNFHDDDEDEPLFKPGDKVVITVRKKQSEN